ncbi:MAG: HEPN domain-containing protein [Chloroflexota bacterium]
MDEETQKEVRDWLKRADEYVRAAEHEFNGEFYARSVSTSYYAMFYAATAALLSAGIERSKHSGVVSAFGQHFVKTGKVSSDLGRILNQTMEDREESDYSAIPLADHALAQQHRDDAQCFVAAVKDYFIGQGFEL